MIKWLLSHQWKESLRSPVFQKNTILKIIIGFFITLMFFYLLMIGIMARFFIEEVYPDRDPIAVFDSILIFYYLINLLLRFMLQGVPVLAIQPYLHLPIKRTRIIHFFLLKSKFAIFNILAMVLLVPVSINLIGFYEGPVHAITWLAGILMLEFTINYTNIFFKKLIYDKPIFPIAFALVIGGLIILNYFKLISITTFSSNAFEYFISSPLSLLIPLILLGILYFLNYNYFLKHSYPEELALAKKSNVQATSRFEFLEKYGQIGQLVLLDIKLIFRHKRTKSLLVMATLFIAYGLFFYTTDVYSHKWGMLIFCGIFMTGLFMMSFGNFLISWYSNFFDGIMTLNFNNVSFFKSKFWLFFTICSFSFILTIPYIYFGKHALLINTAAYFYNIGINSFVVMYFATFSPRKINLNKSHAFNWEGTSGSQFVAMLPMLLVPIIIYLPFGMTGNGKTGLVILGLIGVISLFFTKLWLQLLSKRLNKVKYKISEGFRGN